MTFFSVRSFGTSLRKPATLAGISRPTECLWLKQSRGVGHGRRRRGRLCRYRPMSVRVSRGLAAQRFRTAIAVELSRSVSTVSREALRGGLSSYRAAPTKRPPNARRRRPRLWKLALDDRLRQNVESKLNACFSPQQISKQKLSDFPADETNGVS